MPHSVQSILDDGDEFFEADVPENTVVAEDFYDDELAIVLHSVFNDYLQISLVQCRYKYTHKYTH